MNIPVEILELIIGHANKYTLAALRRTCKSVKRIIDDDISLCWHGDRLRDKLSQYHNLWRALALLNQHGEIVRAAPMDSSYFVLDFHGGDRPDLVSLGEYFKWLDARLRHICITIGCGAEELIEEDGILAGLQCVEGIKLFCANVYMFGSFPFLRTLVVDGTVSQLPLGLMQLDLGHENDASVLTPEVLRSLQVFDNKIVYGSDIRLGRFLKRCPMALLQELSIVMLRIDMRRTKLEFPISLTHLSMKVDEIIPGAANGENFCFASMLNLRVLRLFGIGVRRLKKAVWPPSLMVLDLGRQTKSLVNVKFPDTLMRLYVFDSLIGQLPSKCTVIYKWREPTKASDFFYFD